MINAHLLSFWFHRFANIPSGSKITLHTGHERLLGVQDAPSAAPAAHQPSSAPVPPAVQQDQPGPSRSGPSAVPAEVPTTQTTAQQAGPSKRSLYVFTRQAEAEVDAR